MGEILQGDGRQAGKRARLPDVKAQIDRLLPLALDTLEAVLRYRPPVSEPHATAGVPGSFTAIHPPMWMPLPEQVGVAKLIVREFGKAAQQAPKLPGYEVLSLDQKMQYLDTAVSGGQMELGTYKLMTNIVKEQSVISTNTTMAEFVDRVIAGESPVDVAKDFQERKDRSSYAGFLQ